MIKSDRKSNFELLRIVAMVMVIILHALRHGDLTDLYSFGTIGYALFWLLEAFSIVSTNLFIMVTGYFMIVSGLKFTKIVKLELQVWFYSVILSLVGWIYLKQPVSLLMVWSTFFPFTGGQYWFVSYYVILLMLSPILNKFLNNLSKKEFLVVLTILVGIFSLTPTIMYWNRGIVGTGYDLMWFIVLYCIAAYIRLYGFGISKRKGLIYYIIASIMLFLSRILIGVLTTLVFGEKHLTGVLYEYNSLIVLFSSICLFCYFGQLSIKSEHVSNTVCKMSKLVFAVYLLHDHRAIRYKLWEIVNFSNVAEHGLLLLVLYFIVIVIFIFILGLFIESIRVGIYRVLKLNSLENYIGMFVSKIKSIIDNAIVKY